MERDVARSRAETTPVLVVAVGSLLCAIPADCVSETMRPLATEPLSATHDFVRGFAVIRGAPVPVVDLEALLTGERQTVSRRFVTLKLQGRQVALAVERVIGVRQIDRAELRQLPPLLRQVDGEIDRDLVEAIGASDAELLLVLRAARLIPDQTPPLAAAAAAQ
jgi:purine-binding chemotaxis protein CheW